MNEPTVGPTHPFYKRFKLEWKNIDANQKKDSWYAIPNTSNDYIESKRVEAVTYLKKMLDENVFPRNDYRQVNIFLGNVLILKRSIALSRTSLTNFDPSQGPD